MNLIDPALIPTTVLDAVLVAVQYVLTHGWASTLVIIWLIGLVIAAAHGSRFSRDDDPFANIDEMRR